ncbi:MAG: ABC transporter permease [Anaerolineae bacterium]|nr:ABC transporter permease [Anaerolineae bacterium]
MRNIWTIARKEYNHSFISPIAYVFMFVVFITLGVLFFLDVFFASQTPQYVPGIEGLLTLFIFPLMFFGVPALTMRSVADENRSGTLELLLTAPITDMQLIVGKWLGVFLFLLTMTVITLIYPLVLNTMIQPGLDLGIIAANYLGVVLLLASISAVGVAISAFFSNQIASLMASLGMMLILWIVGAPAQLMQGAPQTIIKFLGLPGHFYDTFMNGMIRVDDITYFVSLTILALVIGTYTIESRRWK